MNATPPFTPTAPPPERTLGGVPHLLAFLVVALSLVFLVHGVATALVLPVLQENNPQLSLEQAVEQLRFNVFFVIPVQVVYSVLLIVVLYAFVRQRGLPFWRAVAMRKIRPAYVLVAPLVGLLLAFLVQASSALAPPPKQLPIDKLFTSQAAAFLVIAASLLLAPLVEELVFRGYIYTLLERLWGMAPAVLLSGLLFGSIHFPQLYPGVFQMLLLCVVGCMFSYIRATTGSLLASILAHWGYNAAISLTFLLSDQFRTLPAFLASSSCLP